MKSLIKHGLDIFINDQLLEFLSAQISVDSSLLASLLAVVTLPTKNPRATAEKFQDFLHGRGRPVASLLCEQTTRDKFPLE